MKKIIIIFSLFIVTVIAAEQGLAQTSFGASCESGVCVRYRCNDGVCVDVAEEINLNRRLFWIENSFQERDNPWDNSAYGYVDSNLHVVIPPTFFHARPFREGYAAVCEKFVACLPDNPCCPIKMCHIRPDGSPLYENRFCGVSDFVNGYSVVEGTGDYDYFHIDTTGNRIYPQNYYYLYPFNSSGKAMAQKKYNPDVWVVINTKGKELCSKTAEYGVAKDYFQKNGYLK